MQLWVCAAQSTALATPVFVILGVSFLTACIDRTTNGSAVIETKQEIET